MEHKEQFSKDTVSQSLNFAQIKAEVLETAAQDPELQQELERTLIAAETEKALQDLMQQTFESGTTEQIPELLKHMDGKTEEEQKTLLEGFLRAHAESSGDAQKSNIWKQMWLDFKEGHLRAPSAGGMLFAFAKGVKEHMAGRKLELASGSEMQLIQETERQIQEWLTAQGVTGEIHIVSKPDALTPEEMIIMSRLREELRGKNATVEGVIKGTLKKPEVLTQLLLKPDTKELRGTEFSFADFV